MGTKLTKYDIARKALATLLMAGCFGYFYYARTQQFSSVQDNKTKFLDGFEEFMQKEKLNMDEKNLNTYQIIRQSISTISEEDFLDQICKSEKKFLKLNHDAFKRTTTQVYYPEALGTYAIIFCHQNAFSNFIENELDIILSNSWSSPIQFELYPKVIKYYFKEFKNSEEILEYLQARTKRESLDLATKEAIFHAIVEAQDTESKKLTDFFHK